MRIWAGKDTPEGAPFRVDEAGRLYASQAEVEGTVRATSGQIGGFDITDKQIGGNYGTVAIGDSDVQAGMTLTKSQIQFRDESGEMQAQLGLLNIGMTSTATAQIINQCSRWMSLPNVGIRFDVSGSLGGNFAFCGKGNGALDGLVCGYHFQKLTVGSDFNAGISYGVAGAALMVYATVGGKAVMLPTHLDFAAALGIGVEDAFCMEYTVVCDAGSQGFTLFARHTGDGEWYENERYPLMITNGGGRRDSLGMDRGSVVKLLVVYDPDRKDELLQSGTAWSTMGFTARIMAYYHD